MKPQLENSIESIESAHEFMSLLFTTILEAKQELEADIEREAKLNPSRRLDALRVALYNLKKLESDINRSRRLLNDLRTLRRLLFEERTRGSAPSTSVKTVSSQSVAA